MTSQLDASLLRLRGTSDRIDMIIERISSASMTSTSASPPVIDELQALRLELQDVRQQLLDALSEAEPEPLDALKVNDFRERFYAGVKDTSSVELRSVYERQELSTYSPQVRTVVVSVLVKIFNERNTPIPDLWQHILNTDGAMQ